MTNGKGVTFVELLVTVALLAVVAGTLVATVAGGMEVWRRVQDHAAFDQQAWLALEVMRREIRQARAFGPMPFEGAYDAFSFPTLLERGTVGETVVRELGRLGYYLDEREHRLCRTRHPYRTLRRVSRREGCVSLMEDVERLRFEYYVPDPATGEARWADSWSDAAPPLAVKVEVGYRPEPKGPRVTRSLVVDLPVASLR